MFMPKITTDLRDILEGRNQASDPLTAFNKGVAGLLAAQVIPVLQDVLKEVQTPVLDHLLIGVLFERVRTEPGFVKQLQEDIKTSGTDTDFWLVLLRVFDSMLQKVGQQQVRQNFMEQLAHNPTRPVRLRASALHRLYLKPSPQAAKKLAPFLESANPWFINAAARTVVQWQNEGSLPAEVNLTPVYTYAKQNLSIARKLPAVLRMFANATDPAAQEVLEEIANRVTGHDRARLINAAGDKLSLKTLATLVQSVSEQWDNRSERALQAVFMEHKDRLQALEGAGLHRSYLQALATLPKAIQVAEISRVKSVRKFTPEVASQASRVLLSAGVSFTGGVRTPARRKMSPRDEALARFNDALLRVNEMNRQDSGKVASGFLTGLHKADALYVDLGFGFNITGQHWHTGVYQGFLPSRDGKVGTLSIAQAGRSGSTSTNVFDFDCIELLETSTSFESPETPIAETMQNLHDNLMQSLRKFDHNLKVHAPRRTPGMTAEIADQIASTAASFFDQGIDYTPFDMMVHRGDHWQGKVSDIQATRCDGVVEFSYEKNGQIVCRGTNETRANIARRGKRFLDNHNDLHSASLQSGELCPRVQAGDQGDNDHRGELNSRMTTAEGPSPPLVESFYVTPRFWFFPPMINFRVNAQRYDEVYVRITVSKGGGSFHFVHTDALGTEESWEADWRFERLPTQLDVCAFWLGKTANGPDFKGQDGKYEFRLVAVDLAGNVSELRRAVVDLEW
jgi:hypothetical protein